MEIEKISKKVKELENKNEKLRDYYKQWSTKTTQAAKRQRAILQNLINENTQEIKSLQTQLEMQREQKKKEELKNSVIEGLNDSHVPKISDEVTNSDDKNEVSNSTELREDKPILPVKILFESGFYSLKVGDSNGKKYGDLYISQFYTQINDEGIERYMSELENISSNNNIDPYIYSMLRLLEDSYIGYRYKGISEKYVNIFTQGAKPDKLDIVYNMTDLERLRKEKDLITKQQIANINRYASFVDENGFGKKVNIPAKNIPEIIISKVRQDKALGRHNYNITSVVSLDNENLKALRMVEKEDDIFKKAKEIGISLEYQTGERKGEPKELTEIKIELVDLISDKIRKKNESKREEQLSNIKTPENQSILNKGPVPTTNLANIKSNKGPVPNIFFDESR